MLEEDKWLTAFVCNDGFFDFNRASFDLKRSGTTFVRAMRVILSSLRKFTGLFVDATVYTHQWKEHLDHLDRFLAAVKKCGLTLSFKSVDLLRVKSNFDAQSLDQGKDSRSLKSYK